MVRYHRQTLLRGVNRWRVIKKPKGGGIIVVPLEG